MTYSLIPPILVVLSIIGIILFLMKKAPRIALLEKRRRDVFRPENSPSNLPAIESNKKHSFNQYILLILEKTTKRLKIVILRLENIFSLWNESIKRKRNGIVGRKEEQIKEPDAATPNMEQRVLNHVPKQENVGMRKENVPNRGRDIRPAPNMEEREKIIKPMISDKIVAPRGSVELKGRLEKLLIERIAANPKDIEAYERLGEYYFEIGNLDHSKECFKQVVKLDHGNINARSKLRKLETLFRR